MALPSNGNSTANDSRREPKPKWNAVAGELYFRGALMLERGHKLAPLVEALLTAFATAKWKHSVQNPIPPDLRDRVDPVTQLRQIVRRLKRALKHDWLDFHVHDSVVSWEDRVKSGLAIRNP